MLCFNLFLWDRHICVSTPRVHTKMFCGGHWWGSLSPRSCSTGYGCVLWLDCCCLCLHQWHGGEFLKTNSSANDIIDSRRLSFRNNNLFKNFATPRTYYKNTNLSSYSDHCFQGSINIKVSLNNTNKWFNAISVTNCRHFTTN